MIMAKSTAPKIQELVIADDSSKTKRGTYIFRRTFFYRSGGTAESWAAKVVAQLTEANVKVEVVDRGEVDKPFRGGASVKQSSHWWVEVKVVEA